MATSLECSLIQATSASLWFNGALNLATSPTPREQDEYVESVMPRTEDNSVRDFKKQEQQIKADGSNVFHQQKNCR